MAHTAENLGGNRWKVTETNDDGEVISVKNNVFLKVDANTEADAIAAVTAVSTGD